MPSVKNVLQFLHYLHTRKWSITSIMSVRSSLKWIVNSSFHSVVDHILVSHFITGLFNLFPPPIQRPKDIWDVNIVLAYWDKQPCNADLPLMLLSQKTVVLLCISTMRRKCELLCIRTDNILYYPNSMVFPLDSFPKTYSLRNRVEGLCYLTVRKFPDNPNICPLLTLQHYIKHICMLRQGTYKVFITTQAPYRQISPMTLRRWIVTTLAASGIDIYRYSAKSTHHASSSKAFYAGVNLQSLLDRAGWVNLSSFVTHYNLPILSSPAVAKSTFQIGNSGRKNKSFSTSFKMRCKNSKNIRAAQLLSNACTFINKKALSFH